MENESLEIIIHNSGLEETDRDVIVKSFGDFEAVASDWKAKAEVIKVTDSSQVAEMKMAREGRLFLREKRIAIENTRKEMKEQSLRRGQAIDAIAKYLKSLIEPIEKYLDEQEHFVEIQAQKEAERIKAEVEAAAEAKRIEDEKKQKRFYDRQLQIAQYKEYGDITITVDTTDEEFAKKIEVLKSAKKKVDEDRKAKQEQLEADAKKAQEEAKAREKELAEERRKAQEAADIKEKELAAERAKSEQLEAERKAKEDQEREVREAEERRQREEEIAKKDAKYQEWLVSEGFDEATMRVEKTDTGFVMWVVKSRLDL